MCPGFRKRNQAIRLQVSQWFDFGFYKRLSWGSNDPLHLKGLSSSARATCSFLLARVHAPPLPPVCVCLLIRDLDTTALALVRGVTGSGSSSSSSSSSGAAVETERVLGGIRTLEALVQVGGHEIRKKATVVL